MLKPKQVEYIEVLLANPLLPDTECAKIVGVNRNTLRAWKQIAEFQDELRRRLKEIWEDSERTAVETMQSLSREGDFKASKYILDSLGYAAPQKLEIEQTVITVDIDED